MFRFISVLLLCISCFSVAAKAADTTKVKPVHVFKPQGYLQAGYVSELWRVQGRLGGAYTANNYTGKGYVLSVGAATPLRPGRHTSFSFGLGYVHFALQKSIKENEALETDYNFLRFAPSAMLTLNPGAPLTLQLGVGIHYLAALSSTANSYGQLGGMAAGSFKAYSLSVGYYFAPGSNGGPVRTANGVKEQSLQLSLAFFPSRVGSWPKFGALLRSADREQK